jgi:hypothetical protein
MVFQSEFIKAKLLKVNRRCIPVSDHNMLSKVLPSYAKWLKVEYFIKNIDIV